ncbi:DUF5713 family protein [Glaesserella parasuis]|uniref:Uncharacterized protein n=4 Tax=Pseudomonadota TaxID=1224 RepID=A0A1T0CNE9_9GAMM|nr:MULTISPECIES: DUF5713 family protein [Pseudomonadota]QOF66853.1 hypothetical protein IFE17_06615 [Actinobacillus sp. GY-402]QRX38454.1 hypothetical protein [Actinobacillus sp.]MCQ9329023.1 DUF5713 family protein [Pelistega suis]MDG6345818.1 DUF5713 family protein [Glaesserella parasuis]MDG6461892.1 DUF5713 family protein [Glaesserella parasuis]
MNIQNPQIQSYDFLRGMYDDGYFPNFLVDKCKAIFLNVCQRIEQEQPDNLDALYAITHEATEQLNELQDEFDENDSEIETVARDCFGETMEFIAQAYGFDDADGVELIAPRDW